MPGCFDTGVVLFDRGGGGIRGSAMVASDGSVKAGRSRGEPRCGSGL